MALLISLLMQLVGIGLIVAGVAVAWGTGAALIVAGVGALALGVSFEIGHDREQVSSGVSETPDA